MRFFLNKKVVAVIFLIIFAVAGATLEAADPVVVELHYQSGLKFYKRGLYDKAIREFEKTLSLDPSHAEAKAYLEEVQEAKGAQKRSDVKKSSSAELSPMYQEGRELYRKGDYEGAIGVFNKILAAKPVDEFASFYKERCEIFISRKMAKEKKAQETQKLKEQKETAAEKQRGQKERKASEREAMLEKRQEISDQRRERRAASQPRAIEVKEAQRVSVRDVKEEYPSYERLGAVEQDKRTAAEQKRIEKERARQQKIKAEQDKRRQALEDKKEKKRLKQQAREQANLEKTTSAQRRQETRERSVEELQSTREAFLRGVEEYGRKEYRDAIASFEAVVEVESAGRKVYTGSALRLIEKAKKRLKESEATQ